MELTLLLFLASPLFFFSGYFLHRLIWVPLAVQRHFEKQGVRGPPYRPIFGNSAAVRRQLLSEAEKTPISSISHDIVHRAAPHYHRWASVYGRNFLYWFGPNPRLAVGEPDLIKEILINSGSQIRKIRLNPSTKSLFGDGLVGLDGEKWAIHRRITNQAFNLEQIKGWVPEIVASTRCSLSKWEDKRANRSDFEIEVHRELHQLSADIISRTAFGSSFEEGKKIFEMQEQQARLTLLALRTVYIPGFRFLPTKNNKMRWKLDSEIRQSIRELIGKSSNGVGERKSLLTLLRSPYKNSDGTEEMLSVEEIIDECKTFYFAGKETTANLLTWVLLLLANHPEWQSRARDEAFSVCGEDADPTAEQLPDLKLIGMILNETLRLYPPAVALMREAPQKVTIGGLDIPAGTQFYLAMTGVHHDPEIWGDDVNEFNPLRFAEPRKHLAAFFPFGLGARICVGQNFAIMEAKIIVAMILRRYSLAVSPGYVHAPMQMMTLQPQHGAQLLFNAIM